MSETEQCTARFAMSGFPTGEHGRTEHRWATFPRVFLGRVALGRFLFWVPVFSNQNAYVERFNRTYRGDVLNAYLFETLDQGRKITKKWLRDYNERRPHDALGRIPPSMFRPGVGAGISTFVLST